MTVKRIVAFALILVMLASLSPLMVVAAPTIPTLPAIGSVPASIQIIVNGQTLVTDVAPQLVNGRTMLPLRAVAEAIGISIDWNASEQSVHFSINSENDSYEYVLRINDQNVTRIYRSAQGVGQDTITIDAPPILVGGRTLVPLRFIAETANAQVNWDQTTRTVTVNTSAATSPTTITPTVPPTQLANLSIDPTILTWLYKYPSEIEAVLGQYTEYEWVGGWLFLYGDFWFAFDDPEIDRAPGGRTAVVWASLSDLVKGISGNVSRADLNALFNQQGEYTSVNDMEYNELFFYGQLTYIIEHDSLRLQIDIDAHANQARNDTAIYIRLIPT